MNDSISTFFAKFMFIIMFLGWLTGCTGMSIEYPDQIAKPAKCKNPATVEQKLATIQRHGEFKRMSESGYSLGILNAEWFGR